MRETFRMEVMKCHQHLFEEVAAHFFREDSGICDIGVKFTTHDSILYDVADLLGLAIRL